MTAPPRAGKTTVVRRLAELLRADGVPVYGFLSGEVREHGHRVGFTVAEIGGAEAVMAHVSWVSGPRVGRYGVNVPAFERVALPALERAMAAAPGAVALIDEIGPMELLSPAFVPRCLELFGAGGPIVATVHHRGHPAADALKAELAAEVMAVTAQNRDELPGRLRSMLAGDSPPPA
ncbi:hypothetical protein HII36_14375 [Nonomuraea sp. NN258]|nr:hypothetical protein [Nonomuraea antri]